MKVISSSLQYAIPSSIRIRPSIVLFGDSLTQNGFGNINDYNVKIGWAGLLSSAYTRRCDVLNRGFSGYNTNHAIELLPRIFPNNNNDNTLQQQQILFCTIFFGANDSALPGEPQHVPIEQYEKNINEIIIEIRKRNNNQIEQNNEDSNSNNILPIILLTPPPVDEIAWAKYRELDKSDRNNMITKEYGERVKNIASQHEQCSVLDTWTLLQGHDNERLSQYLCDGLHLNDAGNELIYNGLMNVIQTDFPHLVPMYDGEGRYGSTGIPMEEKLWKELC